MKAAWPLLCCEISIGETKANAVKARRWRTILRRRGHACETRLTFCWRAARILVLYRFCEFSMSDTSSPFSVPFDLGSVSDAGAEVTLAPTATERASIAHWLEIEGVDGLTATVRLARVGDDEYAYRASFAADVVQACVVTLEPVPSHLEGEFERRFKLMPRVGGHRRKAPAPAAPHAPSSVE